MTRHPRHPLAKALAKPGHELQHRYRDRGADGRAARGRRGGPRRLPGARSMATEQQAKPRRLPPEIFDLPVEKMREGYYTDAYFNHTRETLLRDGRHPRVVMQVFQRNQAMLGGVDEAIAILKLCSDDWDALTVHALHDGDRIEPWESGDDDRGRLHALRPPRDRLPRRADPADADHDEHRPRRRGGERQADHLHARAPRPPPRPDGRRLRGLRRRRDGRRRDRRHLRRAGVLVGRPRRRHRAARADRLLRRQHRARGDEVRRVGEPRT